MDRQGREREQANERGVPVEDSRLAAGEEVRKQRHAPEPFFSERNAANQVAERRAEHHGEKRRREREDRVPEFPPQGVVLVRAELDRHATQDQQPEDDHQGQVEAAERGGVDVREGHEQHAARGDQPDLVAVPDRADRRQHGPPLLIGPGDDAVDGADPEVEAVEHRVGREHARDDREPDCFHGRCPNASRPGRG